MEHKDDSRPVRRKLSGAARRTRAKLLKKSDERPNLVAVNPTRKDSDGRKKNSNGLHGVNRNVPGSISKKSNPRPMNNQTLEIVRQKLVSSLMQILPKTGSQGPNWNDGSNQGPNWNDGSNQGALVPFNGPNNDNIMNSNMLPSWNANKDNMNRMPSTWNNSGGTNNLNQGYWSNGNNDRMRADTSTGWANNSFNQAVPSNSPAEWNNSNNMNHSTPQKVSRGWSDLCPAPPVWGNATNNPPEISDSGRFDSMLANDPRNAGGREYFQGQVAGGRDDDSYYCDSSLNTTADFSESSDELKFIIMDLNMPRGRITQGKRQETFERAFNEAVADMILAADNRFPPIQIKVARFIQDVYKIVVTSERCVQVLQNLVDGLPELWPGAKFRLVPLQKRTKLQKATLFLRSGAIGRLSDEILLILKRQNAGLNTDCWDVYFRKEQEDGVLLILGVDTQSLEYIDRAQGRVFFLTSTAVFRIGNAKRNKSSNSSRPK